MYLCMPVSCVRGRKGTERDATIFYLSNALYTDSNSDLRASNSSIFFHFFLKELSASFLSAHNLFKRCTSDNNVFKLARNPAASLSLLQTSNCNR